MLCSTLHCGNLKVIENCITRLRLEIADMAKISESEIRAAGFSEITVVTLTNSDDMEDVECFAAE